MRVHPTALCLLLAPLMLTGTAAARDVVATRTQAPPQIDGRLTDIVWEAAQPTSNFIYRSIGLPWPAGQQSVVWILYDDEALYFAVACYEQTMDGVVADMVRHDDPLWLDDSFSILFDTFDDGRSGYWFIVNPQGTRYDAVYSQDGTYIDDEWDANWEAAAVVEQDRWVAEIRIPWRSIHYVDPAEGLGIEFWRNELPNDESTVWANYDGTLFQSSRFGRLTGIEDLDTPVSVSITPYATAERVWNDVEDAIDYDDPFLVETGIDDNFRAGVDVDFRPFGAMSVAATYNPDYAHIESDLNEINLSRDELYLNEKRPFFREGKALFELPLQLFYSRRIAEIDYAGKVYGKVGGLRYYVTDVEGRVFDKADYTTYRGDYWTDSLRANVAALRLTHDVFDASSIGVTAVNKYQKEKFEAIEGPFGLEGFERVDCGLNDTIVGLDFNMATEYDLLATGQVAYQWNEKNDTQDLAWYLDAEWEDPNWTLGLSAQQIRPDFDAEMGYLPYSDLDTLGGEVYGEYLWGIWNDFFDTTYVGGYYYHYQENDGGPLAYQGWGGYAGADFAPGVTLYGSYWQAYETEEYFEDERWSFENLFYSGTLAYGLDRWSNASLSYTGGDFYGYDLHYWELSAALAPFSGLTLEGNVEYERLMGPDLYYSMAGDHWFVSAGVTAKFTNELWLRLFGQRNTLRGTEEANALLAWNYLPGSYLYLAYNLLHPTTGWETEHILFLKASFTLDL